MRNKILCLVGASGSGKTVTAEELERLGLNYVNSFTTRKPRYKGEKGHIFTTMKQYYCNQANRHIGTDEEYEGNMYWANKSQLTGNCVYVVTPKAAVKLKENMTESKVIIIYLKASKQNRYIRMMGEGRNSKDVLQRIEGDTETFKDAEAIADFIVDADRPLIDVLKSVKEILTHVFE